MALQHAQQQAQDQQWLDSAAAMQAASSTDSIMVDGERYDSSFEAQADLHRQYTSIAAEQQQQPFGAGDPSTLSYAPPPELVQSALQQAALTPHCESQLSLDP